MAKKTKRVKRSKKTKSNNIYLPIIVLIAIVFVLAFYYFNSAKGFQFSEENRNTNPLTQGTRISIGGFCKADSECFITYCKGQSRDCINSTQMATYSNNCKSYSDWVVENNQDPSVCSCIQNACTMIK